MSRVENPFRAKGTLDPETFCGREDILGEMVKELKAGTSVALAASRRSGKSWLAQAVLARLKASGFLTAYLDLIHVHSSIQWIERFAGAVLSSISASPQELFEVTRKYLPSLGLESVSAGPSGYRLKLPGYYGEKEFHAIADQVYALPRAIAEKTKKRIVVCLDEYPEIISFVEPEVIERWKQRLQDTKAVVYLLASTRPKLILDTFGSQAPMGGLVKIFYLEQIPAAQWTDFIMRRFRKGKFSIPRDTAADIVKATQGNSYYTQMACMHLWDLRKDERKIHPDDIQSIPNWILDQEDAYFEQIWRGLTKPRQSFLAAIAKDPDRPVFSSDFRIEHRLPTASTLQAVVKHLEDEGIIEKTKTSCRIVDPFFQEWLKRNVF